MLFKMYLCNVFDIILYLSCIYWTILFILLQSMLKSYKCIYFQLNVNFIVFIHWMLILYMYSPILYLLMS